MNCWINGRIVNDDGCGFIGEIPAYSVVSKRIRWLQLKISHIMKCNIVKNKYY